MITINISFVKGLLGMKTLASGRSLSSSCRKSRTRWLSRPLGLRLGLSRRGKIERCSSLTVPTLMGRGNDHAPSTPPEKTTVSRMASPISTIQTCSGTNSVGRILWAGILVRNKHIAKWMGITAVRCARLSAMRPLTAFTNDGRSTLVLRVSTFTTGTT